MPKDKREKGEVLNLTELISAVFEEGFKAGKAGDYKDSQEALADDKIIDKLTTVHEDFGGGLISYMEAALDLVEDDEEEESE